MNGSRFLTVLVPVVLMALAVGSCGGGEQREHGSRSDRVAGDAGADGAQDRDSETRATGYTEVFQEAGFSIRWPLDCAYLRESFTDDPTSRAQREFIFFCMRETVEGCQLQVNVLRGAHTADGMPAHPRFVVEIIERRLRELGVRIRRQRPLRMGGIQGVDVFATDPDGSGEVWIRGLLVGADVFLLMAWNQNGGIFDDPAIEDFFASFQTQ
jgi:hypothetical protein